MSINVQATGDHDDPDLNTTINTTPLVDVMLVLLIIFLVTIPVIVKVVPVNLPNARNIATLTKPENIVIAVTSDGTTFYNNQPITGDVVVSLRDRFVEALKRSLATGHPLPEVHIRGDKDTTFRSIGRVVLAAQEAGIQKVGFLTEPRNESP